MEAWAGAVGVDMSRIEIVDVWSLDDDALAFLPRPIHGFITLIPTQEDTVRKDSADPSHGEEALLLSREMIYMKQHSTSGDACGAFGLAHVLGNTPIPFKPDSALAAFFERVRSLSADERGTALEQDKALVNAHTTVAQQGQTRALEVGATGHHFKALVERNGRLIELDGVRGAPLDLGPIDGDFAHAAAPAFKKVIARNAGALDFSVLAVCAK